MLSKETKELERVLRTGNIKEIKHVFGKSSDPLQPKDVVKVLRLLLGRSNFDFEMVKLLKKHHCDLNAPLGDSRSNPEQYRMGDYLSSYGRLSPRLIDEMAKAGYDFSKTNAKGEHAGFYLLGTRALNSKVVAALKSKGVDFELKNKSGQTAIDYMIENVETFATRMFSSKPKAAAIAKLSPLFEKREDLISLSTLNIDGLKNLVDKRIKEIVGIYNKKVYCLELDMIFDSGADAGKFVGKHYSAILDSCKENWRTTAELHWMFAEDVTEEKIQQILNAESKSKQYKSIYCIELGKYFRHVTYATKELSISHAHILSCCNGKLKSAGKHPITKEKLHWRYATKDEDKQYIDELCKKYKNKITKENN